MSCFIKIKLRRTFAARAYYLLTFYFDWLSVTGFSVYFDKRRQRQPIFVNSYPQLINLFKNKNKFLVWILSQHLCSIPLLIHTWRHRSSIVNLLQIYFIRMNQLFFLFIYLFIYCLTLFLVWRKTKYTQIYNHFFLNWRL